ncbi:PREDICTED: uncharacterized protein LOC105556567 [Vollenhovia emeryi]|uniref:uncharacterized protein LOC105556567 n=1 Tax=Vollenhovia emeryi TaxID=411798 RepID=UPI0005F490B8|nr:PREDICTED: uncharacterized protein LOC105556567 [Vollenhovia emeryi]
MASEADLVQLKKRRTTVKSSCTRIKTYVDSVQEVTRTVRAQLEERKFRLEQYWAEYAKLQMHIELLNETEATDRTTFEDAFYELASKIRYLLGPPSVSRDSDIPSQTTSNSLDTSRPSLNMRLPKLDLPKFTGRYDEWFPFRDTFQSVIHSNVSLSAVHKLQYLRAATSDDAHKIISSLEISEDNYTVAWNLLKTRYDNKRVIIQKHIKAIVELPTMSKEDACELRQITDGAARHLQALKALKRPTDSWDDPLIYLLSAKLDANTAREWQRSLAGDELPTIKQFFEFLSSHCQVLESAQQANSVTGKGASSRSHANTKQKTSCHTSVNVKCNFCKGEHAIHQCKQFLALAVNQRIENARSRKICLNCLRSTAHTAVKCPSGNCRICSKRHNTLLHIQAALSNQSESTEASKQEAKTDANPTPNMASVVVTHSSNSACNQQALLSTAIVTAIGKGGSQHSSRVLLDSGSQANFVTKDFLNTLGLVPRVMNMSVSGISGTTAQSTQAIQIKILSRINTFSVVIDCIVVDRITDDLPVFTMKRSEFKLPRNLPLADPKFHISSKVDMLIGAETFWNTLCVGQIRATHEHPLLQKTKLGWILAGRLINHPAHIQRVASLCASVSNSDLHEQLHRFWKMDEFRDSSKTYTLEEQRCEKHFVETTTRNDQGRYIVHLPIKQEICAELGESRTIALNRLHALERRFDRDAQLKEQYSRVIREYATLGHMRPIIETSLHESGTYYMPHHCVVKENAKSTKLRVVFDASCKSDSGISLNNSMMVGPVVQEDLTSILLRFRTFRYVLVADVVKMYRQILIDPSQTRLQRILWRDDKAFNVQAFELVTVTYGTAAASFLATRCLVDLADQQEKELPLGASRIKRDFYVDDLLTGADSKTEAINIRDQIIQILKSGSFALSKWGSNCPDLIKGVDGHIDGLVTLDKEGSFRVLGIAWDQRDDVFRFSFNPEQSPGVLTKRSILSEVSKLFDPLGLIGPITVLTKLVLQDLWRAGVDWDESVPQEIHERWSQIKLQLTNLNQLSVPRQVKHQFEPELVQIHGFCDASEHAYGACVYVRTRVNSNEYVSHLLFSKSRVAPLKAVSLPRLELAAALLLSQTIDKIKLAIDTRAIKICLWSDSTIALNWITSPSRRWSVFVANRVGEIQRLTEIPSWRHVRSADNPADIISRGMLPIELMHSRLWWQGPSYLTSPESQWPSGNFSLLKTGMPEQKITCAIIASSSSNFVNELIDKFSNLNKICRILAYCSRVFKPKNKKPFTVEISPEENSHSLNILCKTIQVQVFATDYESLKQKRSLGSASKLISLSPFMNDDGLIRVGGRLKNSALAFDACHQILLPRNHALTRRIIEYEHLRNMHCGLQATMAAVRQRFWPLSLRSATRSIINKCITCFRAKPTSSEALMGNLPTPRVAVSRPFSHCGVDYAGPVTLREGNRRNSRNRKAYVAVFVCLATKAIHLEVVGDLTTDAFLAALKRLISRRGKPACMYSDNATTFVGAQRQLKEWYDFLSTNQVQTSIEHFLRDHHTQWSFIPPNAPHFGGLWEAAVKSAKFHLTRIIGGHHITFEEMQTILCEIEAILNSRPLVPLSSDPNDMSYISPGHFLTGAPLNSFPSPELLDVNINRLTRWQLIEHMRQHFWSRWSKEYLNSLQERHKWQRSKGLQLEPGRLVLIKQPGLAPLHWLTGRVERVHSGTDGIARSATVRTSKGSYDRPLARLAILPL